MASTKTTGNEPMQDIDPGGTHPTRGKGERELDHKVESGDRNTRPDLKPSPGRKKTAAPPRAAVNLCNEH